MIYNGERMDKNEKKRKAKLIVVTVVHMVVMIKSEKFIKEKVTKQPHSQIAGQLSNTFWQICNILYLYYFLGEKQS